MQNEKNQDLGYEQYNTMYVTLENMQNKITYFFWINVYAIVLNMHKTDKYQIQIITILSREREGKELQKNAWGFQLYMYNFISLKM